MTQKIYTSSDSLNHLIYQETLRKAKANPLAGLPLEEVKANLAKSFKVNFNGREAYHPVQKLAFDEISLIQTTKDSVLHIEKAIKRLQDLGVDAMRNTTSSERAYLNEEYQYLKRTIQTIAKETKVGSISILDVDPEKLEFRMNAKTRDLLGTTGFIFANEEHEDEEENPSNHGVLSRPEAANSIEVLQQGMQNILNLNGALGAVENRLVTEIKKFSLGSNNRSLVDTRQAQNLAIDTANIIFQEAESALASHDAFNVKQITSLG